MLMTDGEFMAFLALLMASDPTPAATKSVGDGALFLLAESIIKKAESALDTLRKECELVK